MKVLLDECVPRKLRRELSEHEVRHVTERGWSGVKNGQLSSLADAEFDVFVTVDQNLKYQQNLTNLRIAIVSLTAVNNRFRTLVQLVPQLKEILASIKPGEFARVTANKTYEE